MIPGKNEYFFGDEAFFQFYDYTLDKIKKEFHLKYIVIDSKNAFNISSFFNTDHHIKQPSMLTFKKLISQELCSNVTQDKTLDFKTITNSFIGVFGVQSAVPSRPDTLECLESSTTKNATVKIYDNGKFEDGKVYYEEFKNQYDFFFGGNKAIIKINNNDVNNKSDRLVIFRDSYASAFAPLLIEDFSEIILIDLRMIDYEKAIDIIGKEGNVLLLYGTQSICCDGISR